MLIECPSCARSYPVTREALGERGRMVVCPACTTRWFVGRPDIAVPERPATRTAPDRTQEWRAPRDVAPIPPCRSATDPRGAGATFAGIACLLAGCMILPMAAIAKRQAVVAAVPRTAALYDAIGLPVNLRGLAIAGVKTTALGDQGHGLEVAGTIRNLENTRTRVPKMTFEIRDAKGTILSHWSETAPKPLLGADETVAFLTQTADLPDGSKDVVVRFETATPVAPRAIPLLGKARPPG